MIGDGPQPLPVPACNRCVHYRPPLCGHPAAAEGLRPDTETVYGVAIAPKGCPARVAGGKESRE